MARLFLLFFWRYFFSKRSGSIIRVISILSFFGISFGVASLILIVSIMNNLSDFSIKRLLKSEPHLVVVADAPHRLGDDEFPSIDQAQSYQIQKKEVMIKKNDSSEVFAAEVFLYDQGGLEHYVNRLSGVGAFVPLSKGSALIDRALADELGVWGNGDTVFILSVEHALSGNVSAFANIDVVGVLPQLNTHNYERRLYLSPQDEPLFQDLGTLGSEVMRYVFLNDIAHVDLVQKKLENLNFNVSSWKDRNSSLFFALKLERFLISLFFSLSILITCLSISIALILLITQKQKDMGIFMSVGMTMREVKRLFLYLGFCLASWSILSGAFLGVGGVWLLQIYPVAILPDMYVDSHISARLDWGYTLSFLLGSFGLAFISSYLPVRYLIRSKVPADILRNSFKYY